MMEDKQKIEVNVKLFATLRDLYPHLGIGEALPVELEAGATIADLLRRLNLPRKEVKLVYVNGRLRHDDTVLQPRDEIGIFPPIAGG